MTVIEPILARVAAVLQERMHGIASVERRQIDARSTDELPAIEVTRGPVQSTSFGAGTDRAEVSFVVAILAAEARGVETDLDMLHGIAHTEILSDITLSAMGRGLRLVEIGEPDVVAADITYARMACTYSIQTLYRSADLSAAIN